MNLIVSFMKRNYKALVLIGVFAIALWGFMPKGEKVELNHSDKDKVLLELVFYALEKGHFERFTINDEFSKGLYDSYLAALDPNKRFFIQADIDEFLKYETLLDDQLINRDLSFFDLTYDRLVKRMKEARNYYEKALENPFDFNKEEEFNLDFENHSYQKSSVELQDKWRKQIKLAVMSKVYDKEKQQQEGEEYGDELEDDDADDKKEITEIKSFEELEKETRESELKIFNDYFDFLDEMTREEWLAIYINAITEQADPHTNYMAPEDKERFDTSMSGKFEGIGARLMKKGDVIEVSELISGGPAWREGKLEAGDLILKVAQEDEEPVDIAGMRLDSVVKLIKGEKGTKVILTVKRVDGSTVDIAITRDIVEMEETYARSTVVEVEDKKYGVIYLPKFYFDIHDRKTRTAARDVALELERLKAENIDGLIIDLRDNGGGSLQAVVEMSGLFIERGPIVQVKQSVIRRRDGSVSEGKTDVHQDRDPSIQWDGPLVVMVNNFSASASEIFAAAMQDYNRGIVIGSKQTYGKGTVQNFIGLNNLSEVIRNSDVDFGAIKITTQKFYRINGGSTQLEGVKSDVVLPDRYTYIDMGEKDLTKAMPWDEIAPATYKPVASDGVFDNVIEKSRQRVEQNENFKLIDESAKWIAEQRNQKDYSLKYEDFAENEEGLSLKRKEFNKLKDYKNSLEFTSLAYEIEQMKNDSILAKKRERWHKNLTKDLYVEEAINILSDLTSEQKNRLTKIKNN